MKKRLQRLWDSLLIAASRYDFGEVTRIKDRIMSLIQGPIVNAGWQWALLAAN